VTRDTITFSLPQCVCVCVCVCVKDRGMQTEECTDEPRYAPKCCSSLCTFGRSLYDADEIAVTYAFRL